MKYKYLFGPVRSRRLGTSLGIDMVPFKTCTLNCVYCECGATTELTNEIREYVPTHEIVAEIDDYISVNQLPDYVTFGGSGEPTLHSGIGTIITHLKKNYPAVKIALLTNSTFLHIPEVRRNILNCDLILPSLDAVSKEVFEQINRPEVSVDCDKITDGLEKLSKEFRGQIWLEVFIVSGINDTEDELSRFKHAIERINPTRIQLNTLDRPGACDWLIPASPEQLKHVADYLMPLPVEIISRNFAPSSPQSFRDRESALISLIKRRPSTVEDIAVSLGLTINDAANLLQSFVDAGSIYTREVGKRVHYHTL